MSDTRRDLAYGAHLALVVVLATGRALRAIDETSPSGGSAFPASSTGRTLALLAMVVGMIALVAVVVLTVLERRDGRLLVMLLLLAAALWSRKGPDTPDLVYAAVAVILGVWWFLRGRRYDLRGTNPHGRSASR